MTAITAGISSLHKAASTRNGAARHQCPSSAKTKANRSRGMARVTGWNSFKTAYSSGG